MEEVDLKVKEMQRRHQGLNLGEVFFFGGEEKSIVDGDVFSGTELKSLYF